MRSRELRRKAKRLGVVLPAGRLPRAITADMIRAAIEKIRPQSRPPESPGKRKIEEELE